LIRSSRWIPPLPTTSRCSRQCITRHARHTMRCVPEGGTVATVLPSGISDRKRQRRRRSTLALFQKHLAAFLADLHFEHGLGLGRDDSVGMTSPDDQPGSLTLYVGDQSDWSARLLTPAQDWHWRIGERIGSTETSYRLALLWRVICHDLVEIFLLMRYAEYS